MEPVEVDITTMGDFGRRKRVLLDIFKGTIREERIDDITTDPGFGSPSMPGSQERKTGGANLPAQTSVSNV